MNTDRLSPDDRAVSDVLGYILIFAIVLGSIGVVSTVGVDQLEDLRDDEKLQNAQRAMIVAHENMRDIHVRGAPGRGTEVSLQESTVAAAQSSRLTVTVDGPDGTETFATSSKVIRYSVAEERSVTYEYGALVKETAGGATVTRQAPFEFSDDQVIISRVSLRGNDSVGGSTNVLMITRLEKTNLLTVQSGASPSAVTVTIEIDTTPERASAWARYFEDEGLTGVDTDASDGTVSYRYDTETVVVRESIISVRMET